MKTYWFPFLLVFLFATSIVSAKSRGAINSRAIITTTVTPENAAPIASPVSVTTTESTSVGIQLSGTDSDADVLTYGIVSNPANGTLSGSGANIRYNPNFAFNGTDTFTYKVNDGTSDSNIATVTIKVTSINDIPVAFSQVISVLEDTPTAITLTANDVDGDPLTFIVTTPPAYGTLSGTAPNLIYTPKLNFEGTDILKFRVNDGSLSSSIVEIIINITLVNDVPVADHQVISTPEDTPVVILLKGSDIDIDPLTYSVVTPPTHGTIAGAGPNVTYTPDPNYSGPDSFTFTASDGTVDSNTGTVSITVTPVNDVPIALNKTVSYVVDTPVNFTLDAVDADGNTLTYNVITNPANGTLSGTAPSLIYTPSAGFNLTNTMTFSVNDGTIESNIATVTFILDVAGNEAPSAASQTVTVIEDIAKNIVLGATDPDSGDVLAYSIVAQPAHGTLSGTGANLVYSPDANYSGADSFTFKASDGTLISNTATVSITVTPVNDPPVAFDQSVKTEDGVSINIVLKGFDADGNPLTYTIVSPPQFGSLTGTPPNVKYVSSIPRIASFTFKVYDGKTHSSIATVYINVLEDNDPPKANNRHVTTIEDRSVLFTIYGSDKHGDPVTYTILTLPNHGTLSGTAPNQLVYTPNPNYHGVDILTFKVNDGTFDSNIATVNFTITPVDDIPVAVNQTVIVTENIAEPVILTSIEVDGDPITYTVLTQPAHGTLSGTAPNLIYTPDLDYTGTDSFTFKVNDGKTNSNTGTVAIKVVPVSDRPIAVNDAITTPEDITVTFNITNNDTDTDGTIAPATVDLNPSTTAEDKSFTVAGQGTYTVDLTGNVTFIPVLNYNGTATPVLYTVKDNSGVLSNKATIQVIVTPVNDAPVAFNLTIPYEVNIPESFTITGFDIELGNLTEASYFIILTQPSNGVLSGTAPNLVYTPAFNFNGSDSFTFKVNDGSLDSDVATVKFVLDNLVNDAPVAINQNISVFEDQSKNIILQATDADANPITFTIVTPPSHGTLSGTGPNLVYTPVANYNGPDSFTFNASDGSLNSNGTVSITVVPVNDAPVVIPATVTINEDEPKTICVTFTDIENDPSVFSGGISLGGNGTVVPNPASGPLCFLYTPDQDYNGQDQVLVTICDASDPTLCSTGVITINILPVNDPPKVVREGNSINKVARSTPEDTPLIFSFELKDPEGDKINLGALANVFGGGTLVNGSGIANLFSFTFTPLLNFNGKSTWTLVVCDDATPSLCRTITIEIDVTPVNDASVAQDQLVTVVEDTPKTINLLGTDIDGDVLTYSVVTGPLHGTLSCTDCPNPIYTPNANYNGTDSFTFKANDGIVDSNVATVSITVTPVNDAPIISALPVLTTEEDTELKVCLVASDAEGNTLVYQTPVNVSGGGTMTSVDGNCFLFMPAKDFNGTSTWTFNVCDNGVPSMCTVVTVPITVTPVNDPPIAVNDKIEVMSSVASELVDILENDIDIDGDELVLTVTPLSGPFHGTVTMNAGGTITYKSNLGFVGADSVRYKVCDTGTPSLCDEGVIFIEVEGAPFKIYNGLSPNGDNRNDYWRIDGIEAFPNNNVHVFDRYNNLIFETSGYNNDDNSWRGQANHSLISGNLPEGTYFYSLDLGDGSGLYSGYIVLKKE